MVHLGPLPGAPNYGGDMAALIEAAARDARILVDAGFDALMVENFSDAPFFADDVPPVTIAAMTRAVSAVLDAGGVPVGVNVLRNDALGALAVAAATGASFIRVNVLSGSMMTDQGPVVGRAAEVARARRELAPGVRVFADVFVKHATPPYGLTLEQATSDLAHRGGADAVVVSGTATGAAPDAATVAAVRSAADGLPILVGSGVTSLTVGGFLAEADGVIVGTSLKVESVTTNPVDPGLAAAFVAAAN